MADLSPPYTPRTPDDDDDDDDDDAPRAPASAPPPPPPPPPSAPSLPSLPSLPSAPSLPLVVDADRVGHWEPDGRGGWRRGYDRADELAVVLSSRAVGDASCQSYFASIVSAVRERVIHHVLELQCALRKNPLIVHIADVSNGFGMDAVRAVQSCRDQRVRKVHVSVVLDSASAISSAKRMLSEKWHRMERDWLEWSVRDVPTPLTAPCLHQHRARFEMVICNLRMQQAFAKRKTLRALLERTSNMLCRGGMLVCMYPDGEACRSLARVAKRTVVGPMKCVASDECVKRSVFGSTEPSESAFGDRFDMYVDADHDRTPEFIVDADVLQWEALRVGLMRLCSHGLHYLAARYICRGWIQNDEANLPVSLAAASLFRMEIYVKDPTPEGAFYYGSIALHDKKME
jgi:hypothetical protein